ncbi:hypothetical protein BB560_001913 [Smittium megazygosporum]|nr:hypothetical protein BB560_001913 [Smittium megazygosporum]
METRPIGVYEISAGNKHAIVVQDNLTDINENQVWDKEDKDPHHGRDVVTWGDNNFRQCLPTNQTRIPEPLHPIPINEELEKPTEIQSVVSNEQYINSNIRSSSINPVYMPVNDIHSRLQAAPKKYIHTVDFVQNSEEQRKKEFDIKRNKFLTILEFPENSFFENKDDADKVVRVEQKFVAGYDASAAFLSSV